MEEFVSSAEYLVTLWSTSTATKECPLQAYRHIKRTVDNIDIKLLLLPPQACSPVRRHLPAAVRQDGIIAHSLY
jgi:hypothetical protein